jgi:hypothetical protein
METSISIEKTNVFTPVIPRMLVLFRIRGTAFRSTLTVLLCRDATLKYDYHLGWQPTGNGLSLSTLQLVKLLPVNGRQFDSTTLLVSYVREVLLTSQINSKVASVEIINEIK